MKKLATFLALACAVSTAQAEGLKLSSNFNSKRAELTADTSKFAGAVSSFIWGGTQFIDANDHGRLLQSAVTFDDLGECFNPTEGGSLRDSTDRASTSRLLSSRVDNNTLETSVDAAFWLEPGEKTRACGTRKNLSSAVNTSLTAGYKISKTVKFGYRGIDNAIEWVVNFHTPNNHAQANFEILTGYMPYSFQSVEEFALKTDTFEQLPFATADRIRPLIVSNQRGDAMGIICPSPKPVRYQFMRFDRQKVVKWNCLVKDSNVPAADHTFRAIVFFGTRSDVEAGMRAQVARR